MRVERGCADRQMLVDLQIAQPEQPAVLQSQLSSEEKGRTTWKPARRGLVTQTEPMTTGSRLGLECVEPKPDRPATDINLRHAATIHQQRAVAQPRLLPRPRAVRCPPGLDFVPRSARDLTGVPAQSIRLGGPLMDTGDYPPKLDAHSLGLPGRADVDRLGRQMLRDLSEGDARSPGLGDARSGAARSVRCPLSASSLWLCARWSPAVVKKRRVDCQGNARTRTPARPRCPS